MASETLSIPEESLLEVVTVIRNGLKTSKVSRDTKQHLKQWCKEIEEYLEENPSRG